MCFNGVKCFFVIVFGLQAVVYLVVAAAGAEVIAGGFNDAFAECYGEGGEGDGGDDVIGFVRSDLIKPVADVFGAVLCYYEAVIAQGTHVVAEFGTDFKGDYFAFGV